MSNIVCLGQFVIPIRSPTSETLPDQPQQAFLQQGTARVHVWCAPRQMVGDLSQVQSNFLGPMLGPVGSCSTPITKEGINSSEQSLIKIRAFVITKICKDPQLRGCIFGLASNKDSISSAFSKAQITLSPIWNYDPSLFFNIPQMSVTPTLTSTPEEDDSSRSVLRNCVTTLKDHQYTALKFLKRNESTERNTIEDLWNHPMNSWIRRSSNPSDLRLEETDQFTSRGSILADDMGLGKTLTSLALVLATSNSAKHFQTSGFGNHLLQSSATLIICPLATLSNWENEIKIHFSRGALTYCVFHGRDRGRIDRERLLSSLIVLTTYEMVGTSGNPLHTNQITIESLDICWFRIVLDEAHMIRNPNANRTLNIQKLKSKFVLCLTRTPFQNRLTDVQSLILLLKIWPWNKEWIWKKHLIPGMNVGSQEAITTLNLLMETVCLRRTKDVLLNLPSKVEKVVVTLNIWRGVGFDRIFPTAHHDTAVL
ncbi:uncharacterized protein PGTG_19340 [Puccinia graminis f. sp. tritici CRL 75-36-700-3]|uniref:Helicase ATP-binding domain-containing protein n=1 Tax=Puccinia graminis f. sp. tritici (strain CRL 75-36-700-3 / race SCCL) TaxID=418459 RepID=E3LAV4_PUCGT|nr:uncharacterized protein PGTG_19340 [Puccinia graminis f. sp. tritici CRL 75-36-700-3]EFP93679.2 hypothetical protein PGTG_19340 [Puccinia graminis f. sp. tritici CRL 75-36-700-3]